jgi:hypothetical protein
LAFKTAVYVCGALKFFDAREVVWREDVPGGDMAACVSLKVPIRWAFRRQVSLQLHPYI